MTDHTPSNPMILAHQRPVFDRLIQIGTACFSMAREALPASPITPTLLIGPTGSGKTFLARTVADTLEVDLDPETSYFSIAVSDWIILGSSERGAETTWVSLADFLYRNRNSNGVVIFLDEACKLTSSHRKTSSWDCHLLTECFQLLDLRIPRNLKDSDGHLIRGERFREAQHTLANKTFIMAGGAFQDFWDSVGSPSIGFGDFAEGKSKLPGHKDLLKMLPREFLNRFRREILILPPPMASDYQGMLEAAAARMPLYLQETFLRLGRQRIPEAIQMQQGCRFIGDLILDTIVEERSLLRRSADPASP